MFKIFLEAPGVWWKVLEVDEPRIHSNIVRFWVRNLSDNEARICYEKLEVVNQGGKGSSSRLEIFTHGLFVLLLTVILIN